MELRTVRKLPVPTLIWSLVEDDLDLCVDQCGGDITPATVRALIDSGDANLRIVSVGEDYAGFAVTEPLPLGENLYLNIIAIRIRPKHHGVFEATLEKIAEIARSCGARACGYSLRPGMARSLRRVGWKPRFVQYVAP